MAFKDILVHADPTAAGLSRVRLAAGLAALHGAYLTGFAIRVAPVLPPELPSFNRLGLELGLHRGPHYEEWERSIAEINAKFAEVEQTFRNELKQTNVDGEWTTFEHASLEPIDARARCADLIIVGHPPSRWQPELRDDILPAQLALACGRPVLAVPSSQALGTPGERILIAWNGSREAARAVSDAMPFLEHAAFVTLLAVDPLYRSTEEAVQELSQIVTYLKRHGVVAERYVVQAAEHAVADAIMYHAKRTGCDLIVMGAYGHSHTREIVLGGVTRRLLKSMPLPILMSH